MVFIATFNNISIISWWSVLLVEETGGPAQLDKSSAHELKTKKSHAANEYNVRPLITVAILTHDCRKSLTSFIT
jgi:hypothetical protein